MHWLSAVRYLPDKDPLRVVFSKEFAAMDSLKSIATKKPPNKSTTALAKRIAKDDTIPIGDKRYLQVSTFHGTPPLFLACSVD
jgi:hypothetical protein